jgi:hypothetical protein
MIGYKSVHLAKFINLVSWLNAGTLYYEDNGRHYKIGSQNALRGYVAGCNVHLID